MTGDLRLEGDVGVSNFKPHKKSLLQRFGRHVTEIISEFTLSTRNT